MVRRSLSVILLGISLAALVGNDASAAVCKLRSVTGACLVWSGSVECGISASGIGNVVADPVFLGCTATGTDNWVVACGNPGENSWTAPGINVVYFDGTLAGSYQLTPGDVDRNGRTYVYVAAEPEQGLLEALWAQGACPNLNWVVIDAVPCNMTLRDVQLDSNGCVTADAWFDCSLPDCETLTWNPNTQAFERRQYECTQTSTNTYKTPVECPTSP